MALTSAFASTPTGPSAPPPRAHVIIFDSHPHHSPTRRGTSNPPGTGRPTRRGSRERAPLSTSISGTRRVGHAPSFVRVANVDATPALVLSRAHASAHDGAFHSRTSFECAAPPLNGAIFLRCENMNASPDEGGSQRSLEVIRGHQRPSSGSDLRFVRVRQVRACRRGMDEEPSQWPSVAISGHQWPSVAISGHQWPSVAISGHQWPSVAIRCHQVPSGAIRCHQVPSGAIRCHQMSSGANRLTSNVGFGGNAKRRPTAHTPHWHLGY